MPHAHEPVEYRFCSRCGAGLETRVVKEGERPRPVCGSCGLVVYLNPKVAACTICMVDGGIVLLKRDIEPQKGRWVFPGGFVDRGETVQDAAIRETLEEVNLRVGLTGILDVYSFPDHEVVVVVYAAHVLSGRLQPGDEAQAVVPFAPEEIPWDDLGFESTRVALRDYLRRFYPHVKSAR